MKSFFKIKNKANPIDTFVRWIENINNFEKIKEKSPKKKGCSPLKNNFIAFLRNLPYC
jgi:hypothetical protein